MNTTWCSYLQAGIQNIIKSAKIEYIKYAEEAIKEIQTYKSHLQNIKIIT